MQDVVCFVKNVFTINILIRRELLLSDDKEGSGYYNLVKSSEVKVTSVKNIACNRFICDFDVLETAFALAVVTAP